MFEISLWLYYTSCAISNINNLFVSIRRCLCTRMSVLCHFLKVYTWASSKFKCLLSLCVSWFHTKCQTVCHMPKSGTVPMCLGVYKLRSSNWVIFQSDNLIKIFTLQVFKVKRSMVSTESVFSKEKQSQDTELMGSAWKWAKRFNNNFKKCAKIKTLRCYSCVVLVWCQRGVGMAAEPGFFKVLLIPASIL